MSATNPPKAILGLSSLYWIIKGGLAGALILAGIVLTICKCKNRKPQHEAPEGNNIFIQNNTQLGQSAPRHWSLSSRRKRNKPANEITLDDFPKFNEKQEATLKEIEGALTLDEQQALIERSSC